LFHFLVSTSDAHEPNQFSRQKWIPHHLVFCLTRENERNPNTMIAECQKENPNFALDSQVMFLKLPTICFACIKATDSGAISTKHFWAARPIVCCSFLFSNCLQITKKYNIVKHFRNAIRDATDLTLSRYPWLYSNTPSWEVLVTQSTT
jgi:hypothetical protein